MTLAITAGLLVTGAVFLILKRDMLRVILGFILLGHAANIVIFAAGGSSRRDEPFGTHTAVDSAADPLPQAFVLTAIVISFSITVLMLVLSVTGKDDDDLKPEELQHALRPNHDREDTGSSLDMETVPGMRGAE